MEKAQQKLDFFDSLKKSAVSNGRLFLDCINSGREIRYLS